MHDTVAQIDLRQRFLSVYFVVFIHDSVFRNNQLTLPLISLTANMCKGRKVGQPFFKDDCKVVCICYNIHSYTCVALGILRYSVCSPGGVTKIVKEWKGNKCFSEPEMCGKTKTRKVCTLSLHYGYVTLLISSDDGSFLIDRMICYQYF